MDSKGVVKKAERLRNVQGKLKQAIKLLEDSLSIISPEGKPAVLNKLANLYLDIGATNKSIKTFKETIGLAGEVRDELTEADALRKLGYVIWKTERDGKKAIGLAQKALEIVGEHPKDKGFQQAGASAWATIGNVQFDKGSLEKAHKAYRWGIELAQASGYKERIVTILGDLGNIYLAQSKFDKAGEHFLKAEKSARKYYRHALPAALLRLGYIFLDSRNPKRDLSRAGDYFNQSLEIANKEGWKREQADAHLALGKLAKEKGDLKKARNSFNKAISIYREIDMPELVKRVETEL